MTNKNSIPFLDLVTPHAELREELCAVFNSALDTGGFIGGPAVQGFEEAFAKYCETQYCIGVGSGTDALRFAFIAAGIGPGDAVVTVPNTFIATTEAISQAGARPVFVDVDSATYNMDVVQLRRYLENQCVFDSGTGLCLDQKTGARVAAIVPVHLYGQMADMDAILEIAEEYGLLVFEDACQAHGAEYFSAKQNRWVKAGSIGKAAAFSFYPGKNLGACGEAGAVTTDDTELARKIRVLRDHGQAQKYYHKIEGYNGRLDAIQAGILAVKLKQLPAWTEDRRRAAARYDTLISAAGQSGITPFQAKWSRSVYHLYVVRVPYREALIRHLTSDNIGTGIHYPVPLHMQEAYRHLGYKAGDFPVSEALAPEILSLPMFPQLDIDRQVRVVESIVRFASSGAQAGQAAVARAAVARAAVA
jgi:dTDP-4-amino-4,6-dideoxygalactose transaminase